MIQLKRSRYFLIVVEDEPVIDVAAFLRGRIESTLETRLSAISAISESAHQITLGELELLHRVPAHEWNEKSQLAADAEVPEESLDDLVQKGLLISDGADPGARRLRQREDRFTDSRWHPYAAFYNLMIKRAAGLAKPTGEIFNLASTSAASQDMADRAVAKYGKPPPAFHEAPGAGESIRLPLVKKEGGLYRALTKRKTVRVFDTATPMRTEDLATLLYYVFGCHGYTQLTKDVPVLHKTSPSGGSLHPVEVYPLVLNVAGTPTGLYHYRVRDHSLSCIRPMERWEAEALAVGMADGQDFAAGTHVLLVMTARFARNFWKYRRNVKTHSVVLKDAAHLSQTFYLVCSDLNLGAYYVTFDGYFIEEALELDGITEGAVGLAGCGVPLSGGMDYSLDFVPYTPGETEI